MKNKIIKASSEIAIDRMYCHSVDDMIFVIENQKINVDAASFSDYPLK